jgi:hypothetical protein
MSASHTAPSRTFTQMALGASINARSSADGWPSGLAFAAASSLRACGAWYTNALTRMNAASTHPMISHVWVRSRSPKIAVMNPNTMPSAKIPPPTGANRSSVARTRRSARTSPDARRRPTTSPGRRRSTRPRSSRRHAGTSRRSRRLPCRLVTISRFLNQIMPVEVGDRSPIRDGDPAGRSVSRAHRAVVLLDREWPIERETHE